MELTHLGDEPNLENQYLKSVTFERLGSRLEFQIARKHLIKSEDFFIEQRHQPGILAEAKQKQ